MFVPATVTKSAPSASLVSSTPLCKLVNNFVTDSPAMADTPGATQMDHAALPASLTKRLEHRGLSAVLAIKNAEAALTRKVITVQKNIINI